MNEEQVYIIQPVFGDNAEVLLSEAIALVDSAGASYLGCMRQTIREINPATFIGEGKLQKIKEELGETEATILFNGDLSPSQTLNISHALGDRKVIDRTTLILDIFASRAVTSEGKVQVELAQLRYLYPRLRGKGSALSRLGGGIGTRGPGETKLETDRRHIRSRIHALEERLKETERRRSLQTERRKKERVKVIALVGYTNTGKSTLLNAMTGSEVYAANALFATLDPTARAFEIEGVPFLMVDTVGFLQDLPHGLIEAFKSTLESAISCDLALIVCDASADYALQLETTLETLKDLGFASPYLIVMNKCDEAAGVRFPKECVCISAKTGEGLEALKRRIFDALREEFVKTTLFVPYGRMAEYSASRNLLFERNAVYTDDGAFIEVVIPAIYAEKFKQFAQK